MSKTYKMSSTPANRYISQGEVNISSLCLYTSRDTKVVIVTPQETSACKCLSFDDALDEEEEIRQMFSVDTASSSESERHIKDMEKKLRMT